MVASAQAASPYPFGVAIDPPAPQNRLSVLLRLIYAIPHLIVVGVLMVVVEVVALISWIAILVTGKHPAGMSTFTLNVLHWYTRAAGYEYLLTDKYPPFALGEDPSYPVRLGGHGELDNRNRLSVLLRIIFAIPQVIVLAVLGAVASILAFIAWIVALFTGAVPEGMHNFLAGYIRWYTRVMAYLLLLTDAYPPFSLS